MAEDEKPTPGKAEAFERERRINRRSTYVSFAAIAAFILVTIPFFKQVRSPQDVQNEIEQTMRVLPLTLSAHYDETDASLLTETDVVVPEKDIVFDLSSIRPVNVSLVASIDGGEPNLLFHGAKIPPGTKRRIEQHDQPYIFRMGEAHDARICLVTASDSEILQRRVDRLQDTWKEIVPEACVELHAAAH